MKKIVYMAIVLLCFMAALVFGKGASSQEKPLVVGMELQFPPFETTDTSGNPSGFTVDFVHALGAQLGRKVEIKNIAWVGLIPAVQAGQVDVVISSLSVTEERKKSVDFSIPYGTWYIVSLIKKDSPVQHFEDLNSRNYTIAVKIGTIAETIAKKMLPNAKVEKFDFFDAAVLEVAQGRSDAAIYDPISIYNAWQKYPKTTRPLFEEIEGFSNPIAAAIKKGNTTLLEQINAAIKALQADGTIDGIADKYLKDVNKAIVDQRGDPLFTGK